MIFELTKEQTDIRKAAMEFADREFDKEIALDHELNHKWPFEIWRKACQLGFIGIHFPEEYGGQGYGVLENTLVVEEFCRRDSGLGSCLAFADFGGEMILRWGSEEQKRKYLPPLTRGEAICGAAFTEPDHGSDITWVSTSAVKEGKGYIINGTKIFITNGSIADYVVVLCQTDPDAKPTHRGQSVFIVEKGMDGFEAHEVGEKMGIKMISTAQLWFNNVKVPPENLVGEENRGFHQAMEFFDESRIKIAAQAVGIAQGAFDRALDYAKNREQFGRKIAEFQAIQHKLAEMATKIEAARLLTYKAAWNFGQGLIDPKLISMAKMFAARVAIEVTDGAVQILGGYGYMLEHEVERFYRDARITEIYEGTREIQKNTIASALLGRLQAVQRRER